MDSAKFINIINTHLAPVLGATVDHAVLESNKKHKVFAYISPSEIALKPSQDAAYRVVIRRSPGFTPEEHRLAGDFVEELLNMYAVNAGSYQEELMSFLSMRAICRHLGNSFSIRKVLLQYDLWSARTYEGQAITASIGIDYDTQHGAVSLEEVFEQDFSAVLTNGFDTLMVVTPNGEVCRSGQLDTNNAPIFAPYRLRNIANWTTERNIAIVLNRLGEQLVFRAKKLIFAKRRGTWMYYPHEKTVAVMQPPTSRKLREAIYESCLDVSYARSGGCIGVVKSGTKDSEITCIADQDRLGTNSGSVKSKAIGAMVTARFQDMDRRLRQELLALDGAMLLSHEGNILAVGAIVSVPSGSEGGGRTAAAMRLSEFGLGIKISEDGEISGFKNRQKVFFT
ncbi:MAG: hypothetical protein MUO63_12950 [Desulfobulbaceae bacterium]|nr:hypothetical protein [Desulfobulbaceae bacterium]